MEKMVPASRRCSLTAPARPLHPVVRPLLDGALRRALEALRRLFPPGESEPEVPGGASDEGPSSTSSTSSSFLGAAKHPTSQRPRMLLSGRPASGHSSHLAPALLHALERLPVGTTPEEACVFRAARRTPPSVLYLPHIQQWWSAAGRSLRASFLRLLGAVPSLAPVLLLATCSVPHGQLDPEIQSLFREEFGEVHAVGVPTRQERDDFFRDLVLNQAAEAPPSTRRAPTRGTEVLSLAPPAPPRQLTEWERLRLARQEEDVLRKLRLYLRDVTERLIVDGRFKNFSKPVNAAEVVQQPMDLTTLLNNINNNKFSTVGEFLLEAELVWRNAVRSNPNKDPVDRHIRHIRHQARALRDALLGLIRSELNEGFERQCEAIRASRLRRAEAPDAPSARRPPEPSPVLPSPSSCGAESDPDLRARRGNAFLSCVVVLFQNVLSRAVKKTEGCEVEPLETLHARLAQCIYRQRSNRDKEMLVQEMKKEIDSFSGSPTSGLFQ
uniref:Bromo domain-containing protein n=1 Tax=Cyclopterus lumpus TaxID=8103 RepID=A0A8C2Z2V2_CYCLU